MSGAINTEQQKSQFIGWLTCFAAALFLFYDIGQMGVFNALNYELMHTFNLDASQISIISSLYFYADVLLLIPIGLLYDRFSTRNMLLIGMGFVALVTLWFAWFAAESSLIIYRILTGAGNAFAFVGLMRMVSRWFPARKAALVTGVMISFAVLGGVIANAPFAWLVETLGWQKAFAVNAYIGLVFFVLMFIFIREPQQQHRVQEISTGFTIFFHQLRKVITLPQNWLLGLYAGFLNLPIPVLATLWGGGYLTVNYGVSLTSATMISSMLFVGLIIGSPIFGMLSDRMEKRKPIMQLGTVISLAAVLLIIFMPNLEVYSLIILFLLLGFALSAHVIAFPTVTESNPLSLSSTSLSFVIFLFNLMAAISQGLFGFILDWSWSGGMSDQMKVYTESDYSIALLMLPILFLVSMILIRKVRETHCKISAQDYR